MLSGGGPATVSTLWDATSQPSDGAGYSVDLINCNVAQYQPQYVTV